MTQSNFGIYADHRYAHPVVRPYSANLSQGDQNMNASVEIDFGVLEATTLEALASDNGVPSGMRDAAQAELDGRQGGDGAKPAGSLADNMARRAGAKNDSGQALSMTPHNGGIAASRGSSKGGLVRNAEERARRAAGGDSLADNMERLAAQRGYRSR
jgi:hypothetical protein